MKTFFSVGLILILGVLFASCASTARQNTADTRPPRLQLTVNIPGSMSLLREEDVSEAFAYRVSSILHEQGFRGRIHYVADGEPLLPDVPVLALQLMEWRVDHIGNVDCTFTASISQGGTGQRLGVFSGTSMMMWSRHDWFARADGFEDAARDAITDLAARLEKTGLLDRGTRR